MTATAEVLAPSGRFHDVTDAALARALRDATAPLVEVRVADSKRALDVIGYLVETVTGFALGTVVGEVLGGVRRWFGDEIAAEVHATLTRGMMAAADSSLVETSYLADAGQRPLVNELASRMHVRLCRVSRDVERLVESVHDIVTRRAPQKVGVIGVLFDLLCRQNNVEERVAAEIEFAWEVFGAVVAAKPFPEMAGRSARSRALWTAWRDQLLGAPVLSRSDTQKAGHIMLVA